MLRRGVHITPSLGTLLIPLLAGTAEHETPQHDQSHQRHGSHIGTRRGGPWISATPCVPPSRIASCLINYSLLYTRTNTEPLIWHHQLQWWLGTHQQEQWPKPCAPIKHGLLDLPPLEMHPSVALPWLGKPLDWREGGQDPGHHPWHGCRQRAPPAYLGLSKRCSLSKSQQLPTQLSYRLTRRVEKNKFV